MIRDGSNRYVAEGAWRWTPRRKAALLDRVAKGEIGDAELAVLGISPEELAEWQRFHKIGGKPALRTTRTQIYRDT